MHPHLFPWFLPIIQISLNGSIWSTVSVTVERCLNGMSHIFDHFIVPITPLRTVCQLNNLTSALHISEIELCFPMLSDIGNLLSILSFRYISVVHPRHWMRSFSSAIYIVPVLVLSILWNVPRLLH